MTEPTLRIVIGTAGSGKSTIAQRLARKYAAAYLDKDAMSGGVWESDNCQKTYEDLKAKGIEFIKPPTNEFYGIEALFKDGCGNWFSLTEHPKE